MLVLALRRRARDRQRAAARRGLLPASSIFLPYAVPAVVAVADVGLHVRRPASAWSANINDSFGIDAARPARAATWILASIGNIVTWEFVGYNMLIFYSALRVVPDRALRGRRDRRRRPVRGSSGRSSCPALRGAIVIATIFSIIGSFQLFNEPNILQHAGAERHHHATSRPNMYAYNLSFAGQQYNYSATVAIVMGVHHRGHRLRRPAPRHRGRSADERHVAPIRRRSRSAAPLEPRTRVAAARCIVLTLLTSSWSTRLVPLVWLVINATKTQERPVLSLRPVVRRRLRAVRQHRARPSPTTTASSCAGSATPCSTWSSAPAARPCSPRSAATAWPSSTSPGARGVRRRARRGRGARHRAGRADVPACSASWA